jgi:hypothetical protein
MLHDAVEVGCPSTWAHVGDTRHGCSDRMRITPRFRDRGRSLSTSQTSPRSFLSTRNGRYQRRSCTSMAYGMWMTNTVPKETTETACYRRYMQSATPMRKSGGVGCRGNLCSAADIRPLRAWGVRGLAAVQADPGRWAMAHSLTMAALRRGSEAPLLV